jgi:hypothetical protein
LPQPRRARSQAPVRPEGIVVDDQLYTVNDLTAGEQVRLRTTLRTLTGHGDAMLGDFIFEDGYADFGDLVAAFTFVIKRRENDAYTLDEALERKPDDVWEESLELTKAKQKEGGSRPSRKGSGGS